MFRVQPPKPAPLASKGPTVLLMVCQRVTYVYQGVYLTPSENPLYTNPNYNQLFGHFSYYGTPATGDWARQTVTLWQTIQDSVGTWDARGTGLGGWTLDIHNFYDPVEQKLFLGDGTQRSAKGMNMGKRSGNPIFSGEQSCGSIAAAMEKPAGRADDGLYGRFAGHETGEYLGSKVPGRQCPVMLLGSCGKDL